MAKYTLHSVEEEYDFGLFGIVCSENQYRMVTLINDALKTDLCLQSNLPLHLKDGRIFHFSLFQYIDEDLCIEYNLLPNHSSFEHGNKAQASQDDLFSGQEVDEQVKLIKELPKTDYFLMIKAEDLSQARVKVHSFLLKIPEIVQVQDIAPESLSSKRNLIF